MLMIVHHELNTQVAHGYRRDLVFYCDPNRLGQLSRHEVIMSFITHWTSWVEAIKTHAIRLEANFVIAWLEIAAALSKFDRGRKKHRLCIKPLWQFLLRILQIMNDLSLASRHRLRFNAVYKAPM
jgi:hypothetical protein